MLIDVTIENFRSIKGTQTLSFEAIKDRRLRQDHVVPLDKRLRLLKYSAVVGANGAGKSTIIRALEMLQAMVIAPETEDNPLSRLLSSSFAYDASWKDSPSSITVRIIKGKDRDSGSPILYCYTLEADAVRIHREILTTSVGRSTRRLFERILVPSEGEGDSGSYTYRWGKRYVGKKKRFGKKVPPNHLFLGDAAQAGSESLQPVYDWFHDEMIVMPIGLSPMSERYVIDILKSNPDIFSYVSTFLHSMDFVDIQDVRISEKEHRPDRLVYIHGVNHSQYASYFSQEPLGTRRLTMIAVVFWQAMHQTKCLLADDFGILLHDKVIEELYRKFTVETCGNESQLLTTGVGLTPLRSGLLRHDEIWFTSRLADGSTVYYCLADYIIRKHDNVGEMYLHGSFGAIPILADCMQNQSEEK